MRLSNLSDRHWRYTNVLRLQNCIWADDFGQGLVYLHENNVAHRSVALAYAHTSLKNLFRDLSARNILFDERGQMYPKGYHPTNQNMEPDFSRLANPRRRRAASSIKYLFIDFGLSSQFSSFEGRELVVGCIAQDATIPELSDDDPYNPFAVDVYTLGNVYKRKFLGVCLILR